MLGSRQACGHSCLHEEAEGVSELDGGPQGGVDLVKKLYKLMIATDATLVEINPLAETSDGR